MNTAHSSAPSRECMFAASDRLTPDPVFNNQRAGIHAAVQRLKARKRALIAAYAKPDDGRAAAQAAATLLPLAALWGMTALALRGGYPVVIALLLPLMSLFLLRVFALMHECGHQSLFRSRHLNRIFGFVFGVVSGMPQYVWARHHNYHHATNGNWEKYRGPLAILSVDEYDALTPRQQRAYARARHVSMAPLAGFLYLILNPRLNWIRGNAHLFWHVIRMKWLQPRVSLRDHVTAFRTRYWNSVEEYRHMTLNNIVLLSIWSLMALLIEPGPFFFVYLISGSLAGAAGIVLFTVQHNFEHAYASDGRGWDHDKAALYGTSFLVLPGWLNWFTANIGYHHIHHLSSRIPNYRLVTCHDENEALFSAVRRLKLADIGPSLKCILWDTHASQIVSVAEHRATRALSSDANAEPRLARSADTSL